MTLSTKHPALQPRRPNLQQIRKMASQKANAEISGSNSGSSQEYCTGRSSDKENSQSRLGRALVQRALFGSSRRRSGGRKFKGCDTKTSPSRLSRVSLAAEAES